VIRTPVSRLRYDVILALCRVSGPRPTAVDGFPRKFDSVAWQARAVSDIYDSGGRPWALELLHAVAISENIRIYKVGIPHNMTATYPALRLLMKSYDTVVNC
jgi:hypothetical protein